MYLRDNVFSNDAPLNMFNDVSHDGPKAFVQDFVIW